MGIGYIGLPLVSAFSKKLRVIGYDTNTLRIKKLQESSIAKNPNVEICDDPTLLMKADFIIICVPTPVTKDKKPDLSAVISAAETASQYMKNGVIVILESTVYPGITDELLVPTLEKTGLKCGLDFKVAYSPERINPGDKLHTLNKMTKVVAGMDKATTKSVASLYKLIVPEVFIARNIKTAEAAKVIENTQRDLNIALVNELAMLFDKIDIDTKDVLDAAVTKWNFVRYSPGLVGGHCIPVDPYYLVHKAKQVGLKTSVISSGRSTNDSMPNYIAKKVISALVDLGKKPKESSILIMGLTYKENVSDVRESPVFSIVKELNKKGIAVFGYDPLVEDIDKDKFDLKIIDTLEKVDKRFDGVIITIAHNTFGKYNLDYLATILSPPNLLFDVRRIFSRNRANKKGFTYLTL
jgi:UDPglucose 6-dehydrogenase/UDP-N-acetyl-D-galactosamine dehydrogenase